MSARVMVGVALAILVASLARRAGFLSTRGAFAAAITGMLALAAGWSWGALLVVYFVSASIASHIGRRVKEQRTASIVAKGGARDAVQVLANGAGFIVAAAGSLVWPDERWLALAVGSLAATELGTLAGGAPRLIVGGRRVPAGTSGGITLVGTVSALAGATFIALVAAALRIPPKVCVAAAIGGIAGAMLDSLLGATLQARRWCDACNLATERRIHTCGTTTRHDRGMRWVDNDAVNFISSSSGGLLAALVAG